MPADVTDRRALQTALARRLAEVRRERYGEDGLPDLAESLGLPVLTWQNYERGVMMPATVLLDFLELTAVEPLWLLTGRGATYRPPAAGMGASS